MINTHIDTPRLILRPILPADAAALLAIFSDHDVMQYWNTAAWTSLADATAFIEHSNAAMRNNTALTLGIYDKDSAVLLGKILLFRYDKQSKRAELGFGLSKACWGKGIVAEAGTALLQYAFSTLGLRRIEAEIDPANTASAKALKRLGFTQEGLLRQRWEINGVVSDSALFGLLQHEFRGSNNAANATV